MTDEGRFASQFQTSICVLDLKEKIHLRRYIDWEWKHMEAYMRDHPNGTLGPTIIKHLALAGSHVTLLTRNPDKAAKQYPSPIETVLADYDSTEALTSIFREHGFESLVILLNRRELQPQLRLIDAACSAGIGHVVPSSFGGDFSHPEVKRLPQLKEKLEMEDYLVQKADVGEICFTVINTGLFFDWALGGFLLPSDDTRRMMIADAGDVPVSGSTLDLIGQATAQAVLQRNESAVKNKFLYVHSTVFTQNQILEYARAAAPNGDIKTIKVDTEKMAKEAWEKYDAGERDQKVLQPLMLRTSFGLGLGEFKKVDNDVLGVSMLSDDEVKSLVAKYAKRDM
ncbi:hypothetical protein LTR78_005379 [Recurvomyces mirabilis]|uniref:NmrA-like domain-containing protein n=1 Tax=Recurvomyces mirabilis TaxID=574656 RepID=A0AAE0WMV4_9PEZI|nr:hypothetical protein LTR78_005379 [Recurvomyces mirabilis]KAK5152714.1 hypothetical protein LTS14_008248 [Recurvomyces mirabilis]